ncbi:MAG: hypothetical protein A2086_15620 [Spirochaetes bacterium GWD1_27_9]|nr:MAG: hypothetical protein A2Z98_14220 [Spirochaetes bacterium GWB1_27_13]OHD22490.1 MAG: hypothetical protein A2Y34_06725 [Spirochaetes bacterium GWC1_27_15]OHD42810.1 MAG: hypothetical protein A2086_15620 [Spirochaetes bacterium GWD1_27_9]
MIVKKTLIFIIFVIFFGCSNVNLLDTEKTIKENKVIKENTHQIKEVSSDDLSELFYEKKKIVVIKEVKKEKIEKIVEVKEIPKINPSDYKIIGDWMINGIKYISLRNVKENYELIVSERTSDRIKIVEKTLFFYKIQIDNQIIEVKR